MTTKPRLLSQSLLARTQVFCVEQLELEFANGVRRCYERIDGGEQPAVMVIPLLDPDTLLLVREYAAGTQRYELGFPKGRMEPGEDALACAQREIREEIGYGARDLRLLRTLDLAPGYIRHGTHLVLARDRPARVTDIAMDCGFRNLANFNRHFRALMKLSPREYRTRFRENAG